MITYTITQSDSNNIANNMAKRCLKKWLIVLICAFLLLLSSIIVLKTNKDEGNDKYLGLFVILSFLTFSTICVFALNGYVSTKKKILEYFVNTSMNGEKKIKIERDKNLIKVTNNSIGTVEKFNLTNLKYIKQYKNLLILKFYSKKFIIPDKTEIREVFKEFLKEKIW